MSDLSSKFLPYLDPHLALLLIDFIKQKNIYKVEELEAIERALLKSTRLYTRRLADPTLTSEEQASLTQEQEALTSRLSTLEGALTTASLPPAELATLASTLLADDRTKLSDLASTKAHAKALLAQQGTLLSLGRLRYDSGDYAGAAPLMKLALKAAFNSVGSDASTPLSVNESLLWGALATFILAGCRAWAVFAANRLAERIDAQQRQIHHNTPMNVDFKGILKSRVWLLHWAAFAFFMSEKVSTDGDVTSGNDSENPVSANPRYSQSYYEFVTGGDRLFNAAKLSAPYLLRYAAAAAVLNRKKKCAHFEAVLRQEAYRYRDIVTEMVGDVISGSDVYGSRKEVFAECEKVMGDDYFLRGHFENFKANARIMLLDVFVRTSSSFRSEMVSEKLGFESVEEATEWVEKRNLPLTKEVVGDDVIFAVQTSGTSNYLQTIAKYRAMFYRTKTLKASITEINGSSAAAAGGASAAASAGAGDNNTSAGEGNNNNNKKYKK